VGDDVRGGGDLGARVGHVNFKVSDIDRSIAFYAEVLGLELRQRIGKGGAFLAAGGYHHHVGLNTLTSLGGTPAPEGHTGLHHVAFVYPDRRSLARAVKRVLAHGIVLVHKADHGVSEAVYFHDPDSNLIEIYVDRPRSEWPEGPGGTLAAFDHPLDLDDLLAAGESAIDNPGGTV
jgi:catechol 2,3-dioxygenase